MLQGLTNKLPHLDGVIKKTVIGKDEPPYSVNQNALLIRESFRRN